MLYQITAKVDGMMCGMCEAHVNDAIRKAFPDAKKVAASRSKKQVTFLSEQEVSEAQIRDAIDGTGYDFRGAESKEYVKKGLFGFGRK